MVAVPPEKNEYPVGTVSRLDSPARSFEIEFGIVRVEIEFGIVRVEIEFGIVRVEIEFGIIGVPKKNLISSWNRFEIGWLVEKFRNQIGIRWSSSGKN